MAKYILVEFEDDQQALAFIKKIRAATEAGKKFGLAGVFQKPTLWCDCEAIPSTRWTKELRRGKKYGWTIHTKCKKARKTAQSPINLLGGEYIYNGVKVSFQLGEDGQILRNFPLRLSKVK